MSSGYVYLIGEYDHPNQYKIGVTRSANIEKRLKELQTANSSELFVHSSFRTNKPFKMEKMLHLEFNQQKLLNEWFLLTDDDVSNFHKTCQRLQERIDALADNPFF